MRIGTRDSHDVLTFLARNVVRDDFVVLKFDVDSDTVGPTMEWGFLAGAHLLYWYKSTC